MVYVAAFAPEIAVTVAVDPHIAVNGSTNWYDHWYMDWLRKFPDIRMQEHTVLSLVNPYRTPPGFEHDHHEVLALAAPRPFLLIGGSQSEDNGHNSDDLQSWGYFNRAREVYRLLGVPERIQFVSTADGQAQRAACRSCLERIFRAAAQEVATHVARGDWCGLPHRRQGETSGHFFNSSSAHLADLSAWHVLQELGILNFSVRLGEMKRNVWLRTLTSPSGLLDFRHVAGHAFAARAARLVMRVLLDSGCMRSVRRIWAVALQAHHARRFRQVGIVAVPCTSWQLKQVTPRVYITLCTKSLPCMRFLCAVPSAKWVNVVSPGLCSSSFQ